MNAPTVRLVDHKSGPSNGTTAIWSRWTAAGTALGLTPSPPVDCEGTDVETRDVDQVVLWRTLHERAENTYLSAAAGCAKRDAETPAGCWTAAHAVEHVNAEHFTGEGRGTVSLVRLQMLTLDLAVHSWDVARSQGTEPSLDDELCTHLHNAFAPYTDLMAHDGAFALPLPVDGDASPVARLVALCGRDPTWTARATSPAQAGRAASQTTRQR